MSAVRAAGNAHLRALGLAAGALFGAAGLFVPFVLIALGGALAGAAPLDAGTALPVLLALAPPVLGAIVSVLWLRRAGVARPGRVTAAAGALCAFAGTLSMLALTPLLALLHVFGIELADTEAMGLLPLVAVAFGAVAGVLLWRPLTRAIGSAPAPALDAAAG